MKPFHGEYRLTLDEKNRVLIPSDVRSLMDDEHRGQAFYAVLAMNRVFWLFPEKDFERMTAALDASLTPDPQRAAYFRMLLPRTQKLLPDKQGRVVLRENLVQRAQLGRDVSLLGMGNYLELWDSTRWDEQNDQFDDEQMQSLLTSMLARGAGPTGPGATPVGST